MATSILDVEKLFAEIRDYNSFGAKFKRAFSKRKSVVPKKKKENKGKDKKEDKKKEQKEENKTTDQ